MTSTISTCIWFWAQGSSCQVNINWAWRSLVSVSAESFVLTCLLWLHRRTAWIETRSELPGMHLPDFPISQLWWFNGFHRTIRTSLAVISEIWLRLPLSETNRKWFYWVHTYKWKTEGSPMNAPDDPSLYVHVKQALTLPRLTSGFSQKEKTLVNHATGPLKVLLEQENNGLVRENVNSGT